MTRVASTQPLLDFLKHQEELQTKGKTMAYDELDNRLKAIPVIEQFRDAYHKNRNEGKEFEQAYVYATNDFFANLLFFSYTVKSFAEMKQLHTTRKAFEIVNDKPTFFTQWLEDTLGNKNIYQLGKKGISFESKLQ